MKAKRPYKITIERATTTTNDYGEDIPSSWATWTTERAAIFYGTGREQREAAQESASQAASFEVLSNSKTRAIKVADRVCYPVTDTDPANWPVWDIQAVNDLGFNEGVRITAVRAAT